MSAEGSVSRPRFRFDVISLFPEFFSPWAGQGVCGRALSRGLAELHCWNPRQFTTDVHQTVDDRPYGGGPGMVMLAEPLTAALAAIHAAASAEDWLPGSVILLSPAGPPLTQAWVEQRLARSPDPQQITLICGRYEGIDQRFQDRYVTELVSLGDFVLSGGEIAGLALLDALVRRLPGALGDDQSSVQDSFMAGLLDHPHYTRPEFFEGEPVPSVLLSGHHGKISDWRREQALSETLSRRPDLIDRARESQLLSAKDESFLASCLPSRKLDP